MKISQEIYRAWILFLTTKCNLLNINVFHVDLNLDGLYSVGSVIETLQST